MIDFGTLVPTPKRIYALIDYFPCWHFRSTIYLIDSLDEPYLWNSQIHSTNSLNFGDHNMVILWLILILGLYMTDHIKWLFPSPNNGRKNKSCTIAMIVLLHIFHVGSLYSLQSFAFWRFDLLTSCLVPVICLLLNFIIMYLLNKIVV